MTMAVHQAFGTLHNDPALMPPDAKTCYETLFPVPEERDQFKDIVAWLSLGHANADADWAELFVTVQEIDACVGMAFLSLYRPLGWWFGNYFGVLRGWHDTGRAVNFWQYVADACYKIMPAAKGIVFETERYQDRGIESALKKFEAGRPGTVVSLSDEERFSVSAALRIAVYTIFGIGQGAPHRIYGCLAMVAADESSRGMVDYVQPAMQLPLDESNEAPLWLMIHPFEPWFSKVMTDAAYSLEYEMSVDEVDEIFDFLYGHVFRSAYAAEYWGGTVEETYLEGYTEYVNEVRRKVQAKLIGKRVVLTNRDVLSRAARRLLGRYGGRIDAAGIGP